MVIDYWTDIACIVFACTTVNHLGLIAAVKTVTKCNRLYVLDCQKCLTFWCVLAYGLSGDGMAANPSCLARLLAVSFLSAYTAVWLELIEGLTDKIYNYVYKQIYPTDDTADDDETGA